MSFKTPHSNNAALLIGANSFEGNRTGYELYTEEGMHRLGYSLERFFNIEQIPTQMASQKFCKRKIETMLKQKETEKVLLYFSGFLHFDPDEDITNSEGFLMFTDSAYDEPATLGYNLDSEVLRYIKRSRIKEIIVILDCCNTHPSDIDKTSHKEQLYDYIEHLLPEENSNKKLSILVHYADTPEEKDAHGKQSVFSEHLTQILDDSDLERFDVEQIFKRLLEIKDVKVQLLPKPTMAINDPIQETPSGHVSSDAWTIKDEFGYWVYAEAAYAFLIHPNTSPPVTMSISAPWGGGKTSLMKMIQNRLDPFQLTDNSYTDEILPYFTIPKDEKKKFHSNINQKFSPSTWMELFELTDNGENNGENEGTDENDGETYREDLNYYVAPSIIEEKHHDYTFRFTVWFNAWKYDDDKKLWAGLAQSIIDQVVGRMSPEDQKKFWLHHNGVTNSKIKYLKRKIQEKSFTSFRSMLKKWIFAYISGLAVSIAGIIAELANVLEFGMIGGTLGILFSAGIGAANSVRQKNDIDKKIREQVIDDDSVNRMMHVPNYSDQMGFEHQVEKDIKKIVQSLPETYKPIVIFIDDLDRCPPSKVARIIEALNRLTVSEINCNFVIGMDAEIVAAALESQYTSIIQNLPDYSKDMPIGWRFMDKFIQLPLILPPPENKDLNYYLENLLLKQSKNDAQHSDDSDREDEDDELDPLSDNISGAVNGDNIHDIEKGRYSSENDSSLLRDGKQSEIDDYGKEREKITEDFLENAKKYIDDNNEMITLAKQYAPDFSKNPREIKRFFNLYRMLTFIMMLREKRRLKRVPDKALARWIDLSLRWPMLTRWIVRGHDSVTHIIHSYDKPTVLPQERLALLETCAKNRKDNVKGWTNDLKKILRIDPNENIPWINDVSLHEFFTDEPYLSRHDNCGIF